MELNFSVLLVFICIFTTHEHLPGYREQVAVRRTTVITFKYQRMIEITLHRNKANQVVYLTRYKHIYFQILGNAIFYIYNSIRNIFLTFWVKKSQCIIISYYSFTF